ncbi:MAG TPA: metallophosphoesterase [Caldilineaceae bacterium]|nr:metallophosphoesterase [Caldilineaceae bacterium]
MRIAHITDLHLRHHLPGTAEIPARLSRQMPDYFARAIDQIAALAPDLLVLSGDLLDYPMDALEDPALQALGRQDLQLIARLLEKLSVPVALVYGNHDHPALIAQVFPHASRDFVCAGHRVLVFADEEGPRHVPQRTGDERARYRAALADLHSPPQIHVQHYVVWPERNQDYPHTYGAGEQMRAEIIASGNVRLVLSGHYHAGVPPLADKGVTFATAPSFAEPPHPFWTYDLNGGKVLWQAHRLAF